MNKQLCKAQKGKVTYNGEMFLSHFWQHSIKVSLIFIVNQTIMENSLGLMAKQSKDMFLVSNNACICLYHTYTEMTTYKH